MPYSAATWLMAATSGGSVTGGGITTASAGCASVRRNSGEVARLGDEQKACGLRGH